MPLLMGYVFVLLQIAAGLTKGFCGKKTSAYTKEFKDAAFINAVRMLFCIFIGFFVLLFSNNLQNLSVSFTNFMVMTFSGVVNAVFTVTWLVSVKKSSYMLVDVILTVSVIIPVIFSLIIFNEGIHYIQIIGFIVLVLSVMVMSSYNNSVKTEKLTFKNVLILVICGISQGLVNFSQKFYTNINETPNVSVFNFYSYIISAAILFCFYFISTYIDKRKSNTINANLVEETDNNPLKLVKSILLYVIIMAICLYAYTYFSTSASTTLPATLQYPLTQGLNLALSLIMSAICFKEKINFKSTLSIILTFIALIMINVLPNFI